MLTVHQWILLPSSVLVLAFGVAGNLLVLVTVGRKKAKHTVHDVFIFNLALSDFILVVATVPSDIASILGELQYSRFYCHFLYNLTVVAYYTSVLTITSMAIQRCRVIVSPFRPKMKCKGAMVWIVVNWLVSVLATLPLMIYVTPKEDMCFEDWPSVHHRQRYTIFLLIAFYVLPLLITASCYLRMGLYLKKSRQFRASHQKPGQGRQDNNARVADRELNKMLAFIIIAFALLMLPFYVVGVMIEFGSVDDLLMQVLSYAILLATAHSCINPLIYGISRQYRREYSLHLRRFCAGCRGMRSLYQRRSGSMQIANETAEVGIDNGVSRQPELLGFRLRETVQLPTEMAVISYHGNF